MKNFKVMLPSSSPSQICSIFNLILVFSFCVFFFYFSFFCFRFSSALMKKHPEKQKFAKQAAFISEVTSYTLLPPLRISRFYFKAEPAHEERFRNLLQTIQIGDRSERLPRLNFLPSFLLSFFPSFFLGTDSGSHLDYCCTWKAVYVLRESLQTRC